MRRSTAFLVAGVAAAGLGMGTWLALFQGPAQAADGSEIVLYSGENFSGRTISATGTVYDLPVEVDAEGDVVFDWNDNVGSIIVQSGTWRLYQHGRCNTEIDDTTRAELDVSAKNPVGGWSVLVSATESGPVEIPSLRDLGVGGDISSIELIADDNLPGWALELRN